MGWVVLWVWIGAAVLAAVIVAFCAYELVWKAKRLRTDLDRLRADAARLTELQAELSGRTARATAQFGDR